MVPPAVPLGGLPASVEGVRSGAGAIASESGGADAASSSASTSMADLTRVLHVSHPRVLCHASAAITLHMINCAMTPRCLGLQVSMKT